MNSDLFYRPVWQQHSVLFSLFSVLFMLSYFYLIADIQYAAEQAQQQVTEKQSQIASLTAHLQRMPTDTTAVPTMIDENELAGLLKRHHLTLKTFRYQSVDPFPVWTIELHGFYVNVVSLFDTIIKRQYAFDIQHVYIQKADKQQLLVTLTIQLMKP